MFSAASEKDFDVAGLKSRDVWCSVNSEVLNDPFEIFFLKQSFVGSNSDPSRCRHGYAVLLCCNGNEAPESIVLKNSGGNMQWQNTVECVHRLGYVTTLDYL